MRRRALLIKHPDAPVEKLIEFVPGPDFPTGGVIIESRESIIESYRTGRGGFRVRAKWETEDLGRGGYQIIITEIPFQVQKSRLIEKIAELLVARKLPLLEDIRDESAEDIRVVLVPKSRTVDATLLMESLFRLTELESRFPLNMNVLSQGRVPKVMALNEVLNEWLGHRREVLIRRSRFRLAAIDRRLEILGGLLIAYLNLDEVIRIIREEDEPKPVMVAKWDLTEVQVEAILNMRLRNLRKLEEFEIRKEFEELSQEKADIEALLASDEKQWKVVEHEIQDVRKTFAKGRGKPFARLSQFADAPDAISRPSAGDDREGTDHRRHLPEGLDSRAEGAYRRHVGPHLQGRRWLQDCLPGSDDRQDPAADHRRQGLYAGCRQVPGGRGHGEPVRIMVDMENDQDILTAFVHDPARKLLLSSTAGNGFVVAETELVANTRKGKQVMNVSMPDEAKLVVPVSGDHVAVVGENRKMLVFPLVQLPEMSRGKGVRLQRYKDGGISMPSASPLPMA